ncbi:MAG TPA: oxygenase MpaB family protein [Anaerolineales bacterium]|nr:oxygenase MpaB family protein [Anaerolineales bacterium]
MRLYFTPRTIFWQVNSDALTSLAGSRALLLELAHPMVAAGVAQHSNYRGDPFGRLYRTMRTMTEIMFTDAATAKEGLRHFNACHAKVTGELPEKVGPLCAGSHYTAHDPILKLWVLATLYDSCLLVYDRMVRPLALDDKREYYRDGLVLGELLGIPRSMMPPTFEAFDEYVRAMIDSNLLTVSDTARDVAEALWAAPVFGPAAKLASFVGIGLLPKRIRCEFGFEWDDRKEKWLGQIAAASRRLRPLVPSIMAVKPRALMAEWSHHHRLAES